MVHLVDSVSQYVGDRVAAAGAWLEQAVQGCTSLDQMHARRSKYQRAVTRYCLLRWVGLLLVGEGREGAAMLQCNAAAFVAIRLHCCSSAWPRT